MSNLNGTWTLNHRPGITITGAGTNPFPAPAPIDLDFTFLPGLGVGVLEGEGRIMVMFPADSQAVSNHLNDLWVFDGNAKELMPDDNAPCGWSDLPALIGTTSFALVGQGPEGNAIPFDPRLHGGGVYKDARIILCAGTAPAEMVEETLKETESKEWLNYRYFEVGETKTVDVVILEEGESYLPPDMEEGGEQPRDVLCAPDNPSVKGDLEMTLLLKFSSNTAAGGLADFQGVVKAGGQTIRFAAQTPLTMSR